MKTILQVTQLIIVAFLAYNCAPSQSPNNSMLEEAKIAISKSNDIYFQSFATGDSSLFIDRYAKGCCIMPPNTPALCGEQAPLEFFKIAYTQVGLRNGKFITTAVYGSGEEYVTEEGIWQSFDANDVMFDHGKFLVLWKKTPDGWKMYRDSFNSDQEKMAPPSE